ncbi:hypothetical protein PISL3812_03773 [Talaromyces islandicus]|uniref:ER membrane protein complex subunit 4 n=1 Tax=Talaromyces islandicus TaxID=28573 RepID=A0A0U1LUI0_TALIS|nr:hypothetical protein PISL3812_03773 [Talaromyces islandicus]
MSTSPLPPKWVVEMNTPLAKKPPKAGSIRNPPGFATKPTGKQQRSTQPTRERQPAETEALKLKKAWEVALAPSKQIPMNAIMMYMSGNSLQIFSIMMVFMLFKGPIQGLIATNAQFLKFETESNRAKLWGCKAVYVLMQLVLLGLELQDRIGSHGRENDSP